MSPKSRKSPRQHPVHTKHPRYQTPEYQRGQGGQQTLGGRAVNPQLTPEPDLVAYGMRIMGRVPDGMREKQATEYAKNLSEENNATIVMEKAKYKTPDGRYLATWRLWHDPYDKDTKVIRMDEWSDPTYKQNRQKRFAEHGFKYRFK